LTLKVTSFSDIAGQITAKSHDADKVTVGSVCLPTGGLKSIRKRIPNDFPKWRNACDADVTFMLGLILKEAMGASASSIDKSANQWQNFWQDASRAHSKTASLAGGSISFIKGPNLIKYLLFSQSGRFALAHAIKVGSIPRVLDMKGLLKIQEDVVIDNDIQGNENVDAFVEIFRSGNSHQPLVNLLGIEIETKSLRITTEQDEPLLLLADYVAGVFHAANSESHTLASSKVSVATATFAYQKLLKAKNFYEFSTPLTMEYSDIFPDFKKFLA
jgi:hypothetical protein